MSKTEVSGKQVKDGSIELVDLSSTLQSTISGKADASSVSADIASLDSRVDALEGNVGTLNNVGALNDLSDVVITSPSADQVLKYDGVGWVNSAAPAAGATDLDGLSDVAVTSAAKGQFIVHNGTSFVNSNTIEASGAAVKPLIVKGAASQSANLFEVQNSGGYDIFAINSSGYPVIKNLNAYSYQLNTNGAGALAGRGVVTCVTYTGGTDGEYFMMSTGLGTSSPDLKLMNINLGTQQIGFNTAVASISGQMHLTVASASRKGFVLQAAASQTGNLLEIQNSAGTPIFYTNSNGRLFIKNATANDYLQLGFSTDNNQYGMVCGVNPGSGYQSTYIGAYAGQRMTGAYNTAVGTQALWGQSGASGTSNIGIGGHCGYSLTSGSANTLVGYQSGYSISTGGSTVAIGSGAGYNTSTGTNNVFVGTNAGAVAGAATNSHQIAIGSGATTSGDYALAIGRSASAAANCMDIRFGNASQITGDASGNITVANALNAKRFVETSANTFSTSLAPSSGILTVDSSAGNVVLGALSASVTTWAFTNVPTDNSRVTTVSAVIAGNTSYTYGSSCSVNGSAVATGVQWFGGTAPTPSSSTDVLTFVIIRDSAGTIRVLGSAQTIDSVIGAASAGIDGAGSANYLSKWTDANTIANSAVFESGGKVGIGTTSPTGILHVSGSGTGGTTARIVQTATSLTNGAYTLEVDSTSHNSNMSAAGAFKIGTNTQANALVVDGNGRLGIGTASPTEMLSILAPASGNASISLRGNNVAAANELYVGQVSDGTAYVFNRVAGSLIFGTSNFERARIDSSGRVGIGMAPAGDDVLAISINNASLTGKVVRSTSTGTSVTSHYAFKNGNGDVGFINTSGSSTSFQTTSDYRLKENIIDLPNAIERLNQLKPRQFNFKADPELTVDGFIAHELQDVIPDAVSGQKDEVKEDGSIKPQAVDYSRLTPLLAAALKELSAKVDALQAEKEALEARIAALENN